MSKRSLGLINFLFTLFCFYSIACAAAARYEVASPDGNLTIALERKAKAQPYLPGMRAYYHVSYKGKALLVDSPLGLDFLNAKALDQDFEVVNTARESHDSKLGRSLRRQTPRARSLQSAHDLAA